MFRKLSPSDPGGRRVLMRFEGREIEAAEGENLAAVLLGAGEVTFRESPVSGASRGPFCMMGVCFECLVEIDGSPGHQACMTSVREGMVIRRDQTGERAG